MSSGRALDPNGLACAWPALGRDASDELVAAGAHVHHCVRADDLDEHHFSFHPTVRDQSKYVRPHADLEPAPARECWQPSAARQRA